MHYKCLYSSKMYTRLLTDKFIQRISTRHMSTGLNLWEHDINAEMKHKIEQHWKHKLKDDLFDAHSQSKEKFYVLSMFPYPSGQLHMGHVRVYSISDTIARFYRMKGKNVLHPMGWDAFGLPAENAAMERGLDPVTWTEDNIKKMRVQMDRLGCSFDWECELSTSNPDYYRWTQELFIKLFENDLIYRKEALVNWDPVDQTVLADEQVDDTGCSWRSGAKVEKKILNQWFIRTTAFAKPLLDGLNDPELKEWRDVINLQKHWIGECNGLSINCPLISDDPSYPKTIDLWTDKLESIEDAKFVAVSSGSFLDKIEGPKDANDVFKLLNTRAVNPFNNKELPIYVTDAIEYDLFTDSHIGIPTSSDIDAELCKTFGIDFELKTQLSSSQIEEKRSEILKKATDLNIGRYPVSSKLRDWLISRQRYWGTPIPIVHCEHCKVQPVSRDQLPVVLPKLNITTKSGISPLLQATEWLETKCPKCGGKATRETDTMDTFMDSSWYFMRYIDSKNNTEMFSKETAKEMLPVDLYIGGKEHAVLHLYYARFISHFLHSQGLVPTREPFRQLLVQGMVNGQTYRVQSTGKYLKADEVEKKGKKKFVHKESGSPVVTAWEKMSKSKYNGVDPVEIFNEHGTDMTRLIILADVAPTSPRNWSTATFPGIINWQHRLWLTIRKFIQERKALTREQLDTIPNEDKFVETENILFDARNYYIMGVTKNIMFTQQLSVAISKMQGLTNSIRRSAPDVIAQGREYERTLAAQIIMLAPFAPHFASELWAGFCSAPHLTSNKNIHEQEIQWDKGVLQQNWPEIDMEYKLSVNVVVNGVEAVKLEVPRYMLENMTSEDALRYTMESPNFQTFLKNWRVVESKFHAAQLFNASIEISTEKPIKELEMQETQV
ncbi:probable leucine--tRNA ligase, mitochondrial [Diprion similis]|uniref:probable leucine--tRNA ligase, mitochondrial n=1 Tax=Diprion similis TaxID=362088 RepID=UPI001EF797AA|nr:probable leucine--tRNA ligase, mitochondrial [Diprion similis]